MFSITQQTEEKIRMQQIAKRNTEVLKTIQRALAESQKQRINMCLAKWQTQ